MGTLDVYLIRHAAAEERGFAWPDDDIRPLSAEGRAGMRKAARGLVRLGVTFNVILTSPLVRARQTAEVVAEAFDARPPIVVVDALAPGGRDADLLVELTRHSHRRAIAMVGHEPDLGELAVRLVGSERALAFKKGAVCRIDLGSIPESIPPAQPGILRWFLTPAVLRAIKG